ncbi:hypothetical protein FQZ97_658740 [compost metagenome]
MPGPILLLALRGLTHQHRSHLAVFQLQFELERFGRASHDLAVCVHNKVTIVLRLKRKRIAGFEVSQCLMNGSTERLASGEVQVYVSERQLQVAFVEFRQHLALKDPPSDLLSKMSAEGIASRELTHGQGLLGASHAHVVEPTFIAQSFGLSGPAAIEHHHVAEFQSFGRMDSAQIQPLPRLLAQLADIVIQPVDQRLGTQWALPELCHELLEGSNEEAVPIRCELPVAQVCPCRGRTQRLGNLAKFFDSLHEAALSSQRQGAALVGGKAVRHTVRFTPGLDGQQVLVGTGQHGAALPILTV